MTKANRSTMAAATAPTAQELFERLARVASDLSETCTQVEDSLSSQETNAQDTETSALQNLDRMTQNLFELSKLMKRLSESEDGLPEDEISAALQTIMLPSLRSFLADGDQQDDAGSVELF